MASGGTMVRRVLLQIAADDGDTEARLDKISAKAEELSKQHPELAVRINTAAASAKLTVFRDELKDVSGTKLVEIGASDDPAKAVITDLQLRLDRLRLQNKGIPITADAGPAELKIAALRAEMAALSRPAEQAGVQAGSSFGGGFGAQGYLITAAVVAAVAALPALMAAAGATAGIALGAALLIGTSKVKGPLYAQFHSLTQGLLGEVRTAALPLVQPLAAAFKQVGAWAQALKPELTAVFASVGPSVMPLAKGLEGIVSGVLPGFISLMKAARPAVSAVGGVLSQFSRSLGSMLAGMGPAVKNSSTFLRGLGGVASSLLPVIGQLASTFSALLAPVMRTLGSTVMPLLSRAVTGILKAVGPLLPGIGGLASQLLVLAAQAVTPLIGPVTRLVAVLARDMQPLLPPLTKALAQLGATIGGQVAVEAQQLIPPLIQMIDAGMKLYNSVVIPLLPPLTQLAGSLVQVTVVGIQPMMGPLTALMDGMTRVAGAVEGSLVPALQTLVGWLSTVANAASTAIGFVEGLLGISSGAGAAEGGGGSALGALSGVSSEATVAGLGGTSPPHVSMPTYSAPAGFGGWGSGLDDADVTGAGAGKSKSKANAAAAAARAKQKAAELAEYQKFGQQITASIGSGVKTSLPTAEADARQLAKRVHDAVTSGQITTAQADKLVSNIDKQLQSRANKVQAEATKLGQSLNGALVKSIAGASSASAVKSGIGKLLDDVKAAWTAGMISLQRDQSLTKWLDAESAKLQALETKRAAVTAQISKAKDYAATTASGTAGAYSFSDFASGNGVQNGPMSGGQIIRSLQGDLIQVRQFSANIKKLAKAGLNKNYLQQLISMGPVQGGALAQELAGTAISDIKTINTLEYRINQASGQLGKSAANTFYDTAKDSSKGFLDGLEASKAKLSALMTATVKSAVSTVKKDLGVKAGANQVTIKLVGGDKDFRTWLKKQIRVTGGNVQVVGA